MRFDQTLKATNITLFRGENCVLRKVSVSLSAGDICIIRGANGSGKTSLLSCLAGLTQPDIGAIETRPPFNWIGHKSGVKARETPRQHIQTWGRAFGSSHKQERESLEAWGLAAFCDLPAKHLSQGQKRRTALARLDLAARPLWLLDEPFSALDTKGCSLVSERIAQHAANGGIIVTALHEDHDLMPTQEIQL